MPKEKIDNTELLRSSGLRVVHVRPDPANPYGFIGGYRGMTVAYRPSGRGAIQISTAVCKRGDTFCKKIGTKTAIENFQRGNTVFIPVDQDRGEISSIQRSFGY